ncbi:MAG: DEAD/DEAH box helicase [Chloroflexota bacterium]|nr:DEAD/DEAH box helicase [Chloroflexota bacterium]
MSTKRAAIESLASHWAIQALADRDKNRSDQLTNELLADKAVGQQISFAFAEAAPDFELLGRVALAYEIAATEGLEELCRPESQSDELRLQSIVASSRAFDIRRLIPVPQSPRERMYSVLHLSAIAYCGDRWSDLRRWYLDNAGVLDVPSVAEVDWDQRLLIRIFHCWVRLFRKRGWDDLDRVRETIAGLREDQSSMEHLYLDDASSVINRSNGLRLIALYNWAKSTETLALYMLQGGPTNPIGPIDKHFEAGIKAATACGDPQLEMILRWLHATAHSMITNSLWWSTRSVGSKTSEFVRSLVTREHRPMFELLPPQRAALTEQGLLDQGKTAIVIDLPTSGGKTLLAEFRILQALNQFDADQGWVAYVAPTRALTAQITRRLRSDLGPIGIRVEHLSSAIEIDAFEDELLAESEKSFDVLIATPEKLSLILRNSKVDRPLALVVMDEAHNLENRTRGMRIELLLATVKRDSPSTNFLLMLPDSGPSQNVTRWLANDIESGQTISLGTAPWKPNERIVGLFRANAVEHVRAGWQLTFETLSTSPRAMALQGTHRVGSVRPLDIPKSRVISKDQQSSFGLQTAAMSAILATRGTTSIAVANNIKTVWTMAEKTSEVLPRLDPIPDDVQLVQDFLRSEYGPDFQLVESLEHGVGVHHAGLSDEARALMEWLAENGHLKVLCATSTIAQGINFPVSSVFLSSRFVPGNNESIELSPRDFWNLAGRAGRIDQDEVGVVGIAEGRSRSEQIDYLNRSTDALVSRLVTLLDDLAEEGKLRDLSSVIWQDQWEDFRCYIAHLWAEKKNLEAVLADSENLLRQTFGYTSLRNDPDSSDKADALLDAAKWYAREVAKMPAGTASLADATGFSPEGVQAAIGGVRNLEEKLYAADWEPESLFGEGGKMAALFGVMLKVPQLRGELEAISKPGSDHTHLADVTRDWVNGKRLDQIAKEHFAAEGELVSSTVLSNACRAIYRAIVNNGTWGISAITQMSGLRVDDLSESELRAINSLPAMIYHGVRSEDAVLMRMNSAPRSAAEALGQMYRDLKGERESRYSVGDAREFLQQLGPEQWERARPEDSPLTGTGYKRIWEVLSGTASEHSSRFARVQT